MNDNNSFTIAVKKGEIKQPTQNGFLQKKWTKAFESFEKVTDEDKKIYLEGLWFNEYLRDIRSELKKYNDKIFDLIKLRQMYIGLINRDYCVVKLKVADFFEENQEKEILLGELAEKKFPSGHGNFDVNLISVIESSSSAVRFPLSETFQSKKIDNKKIEDDEILKILKMRINLATLYSFIADMWGECLWNKWSIEETDQFFFIKPPKTYETINRVTSLNRLHALLSDFASSTCNFWMRLPDAMKKHELNKPRIIDIVRKGKRKVLKLGGYENDFSIMEEIGMAIVAEEQYWDELLEMPLPNLIDLSIRDIIEVWELISSLGKTLNSKLPTDTGIFKVSKLIQFSPKLRKSEIVNSIKKATGFSHSKVLKIIDLFAFNGDVKNDPWLKPFICLDKDYFCFLLPPMIITNRIRLIESWMRDGGINLNKRGNAFEDYVRREVSDYLKESEHLCRTFFSQKSIELSNGDEYEEIDFIWIIGSIILIGEIKCSLFPTNPIEFHNFYKMLDGASLQAKRKAAFVKKNLQTLYQQLNIKSLVDEENIDVVPFVLTNLLYGSGNPINDVAITDLRIIGRFINGHQDFGFRKFLDSEKDSDDERNEKLTKIEFYGSKEEAEERIVQFLKSPPLLKLYSDAISSRIDPMVGIENRKKGTVLVHYYVDESKMKDQINDIIQNSSNKIWYS